MTCFGLTIVSV